MSPAVASDPAAALELLAAELREEGGLVADHVTETDAAPGLGMLAAAGPRCRDRAGDYAAVVEAVREGWLLHYGRPRLLPGLEPDLRLLIGDHLYARGIERLAGLGDMHAVAELADLISLTAQLDAAGASPAAREVAWLAAAVAIGTGAPESHERDKADLRGSGNVDPLWEATRSAAERAGLAGPLALACESVGFRAADLG